MNCVMENFELASRHAKFTEKLWEAVCEQDEALVLNKATKESNSLYSLHRQVANDYQRCRAFSRLKISKHGIIYGRIDPEHEIEDMVADWFLSRFPLFVILLESRRGTFINSHESGFVKTKERMMKVVRMMEKTLPENNMLKDLIEFDELSWENLYDANFIKQRKNVRLFLKNIPKKYHNNEGLAMERRKFMKCRRLDEFI
ncbi:DUF4130 domain-containing protein [Candidatus Woesearchaeota archaeon]|nr:DUF4130 domain-containing protein [Candidatus Woesearchaeota archaeon]